MTSIRSVVFVAASAMVLSLQAAGPVQWQRLTPRATNGQLIGLDPTEFTVVCFLGTECPLAQLYGSRLQSLADRYGDQGVQFLGVNSNIQDSPAEIDAYAKQHAIRFPIAKDADQSVAAALGATRTPEVFVIDPAGWVRYQGRIDDQYEPGISRPHPTQHDLKDAIAAVLAGAPVRQPKTQGVGCLITRLAKSDSPVATSTDVTFNRDIAPLLNKHCVECHRPGEIGPMELTDYDEVVGWGQMILEVIDQGRMPPWHADRSVGHFVGERHLPPKARNTIATWLDNGMPQGDPADLPTFSQRTQRWQFQTDPDGVVVMRDRPFMVPADGVVEYQYFVVDPQWKEDRWIRAAQVIPGDASVVHHAIVFVRPPDGSDSPGIGWLAAYVPGQRAVQLPGGHARFVPAGSKLVFQMHYTPNGTESADQTEIGIWSVDSSEVTHEVFTQLAIDHEFEIPPGAKDHQVNLSVDSFPPQSRMLGITPHMHLRGKSFELTARGTDGQTQRLLSVPHYDFNWQHWYEFSQPVDLDALESLQMTVTFDNSAGNPFNPEPGDYVSWGDQTWEEMAIAFFDVAIPRGGRRYREKTAQPLSAEKLAVIRQSISDQADQFLKQMDLNQDGVIERDEAPMAFRRFGFRQFDHNRNGRIERDELQSEAADRL
ncbi:redoxin domain-containing protein [Stieleria sp. TO1_6]|uniref:redoxin domain-containing protein n=1 Tax=Stieleria tagensis TaxID=2956795 RepID=UPI00209B044A|nr:redoxin domain-containing protein [Stieleria tagensis]MCO8124376.1 redoxin domain-containing protein [Stieleria tagensis]